jgi:hypothetical protein
MKEILDSIDNLRIECPAFISVMIEIASNDDGERYVIRTDAYHKDLDRSFCIRVPFTKMKDGEKALEDCILKMICAYNDADIL